MYCSYAVTYFAHFIKSFFMKNLHFFIATAILLFPRFLHAQQTPQFQITLHFEDAIGNKDSIIVGYDQTASYDQLNPQFGEALIETPFDSVFEVRAMHGDVNQPLQTSKIIIGNLETSSGSSCGAMEFIRIVINADNFPITVRYDSALINSNVCQTNMILSPDHLIFVLENWQEARVFYCLSNTNKIIDDFEYFFHNPEDFWLREAFEVEGQGSMLLPGYYFGFFLNDGYCATISDTEYTLPVSHSALLYPNPNSSSSVMFDLGETVRETQIALYDLNGRCLRCFSSFLQQTISIDLEGVPAGIYFVGVSTPQNSKPAYYKLIRQ